MAAAATGVDVLVLMVATPAQVESVLYGDGNAAVALEPGAAVVIMATVGATPVQDWARRLATQQVDVVDAPVSGGVARARQSSYPTPLATVAEQLYLTGRRAGLGRLDDSSLINVLRGQATTRDAARAAH